MAWRLDPSRRLAMLKVHALLDYAFSVSGMAYLGMYMASLGFSIEIFFAVSVITVLTALVSQNLLARRSDIKGERLPYLLWSKGFYAASMLLVAFLPSVFTIIVATVLANLISGEMITAAVVYEIIDEKATMLASTGGATMNKATEFSRYRIFGSLGWAFTAPVAGFAIEALNAVGEDPLLGYRVLFTISAAGVLALGVFLRAILLGLRAGVASSVVPGPRAHGNGFRMTLPYVMLLSSSLVFSIAVSIQSSALAPFLKSGLGLDEGFFGLMMFTWATSEVPLFFLSSHLTKRAGWRPMVLISYAFLLVKLAAYMIVVSPVLAPVILLVQILNPFGISFPAKTYAITNELARNGKALGMSLYHTSNAVGSFVGGLLGMVMSLLLGPVANTMEGYRAFFGVSFIVSCVAISIFVVLATVDRVRRGQGSHQVLAPAGPR